MADGEMGVLPHAASCHTLSDTSRLYIRAFTRSASAQPALHPRSRHNMGDKAGSSQMVESRLHVSSLSPCRGMHTHRHNAVHHRIGGTNRAHMRQHTRTSISERSGDICGSARMQSADRTCRDIALHKPGSARCVRISRHFPLRSLHLLRQYSGGSRPERDRLTASGTRTRLYPPQAQHLHVAACHAAYRLFLLRADTDKRRHPLPCQFHSARRPLLIRFLSGTRAIRRRSASLRQYPLQQKHTTGGIHA